MKEIQQVNLLERVRCLQQYILYFLSNFTLRISPNNSVPFITSSLYSDTRMVMTYLKMDPEKIWSLIWVKPRDRCSVFNVCGNFGSCNSKHDSMCKCLPGFKPHSLAQPRYLEVKRRQRTQRVVGTCGDMSPEYALDGHFSVESDVFSFGVVDWWYLRLLVEKEHWILSSRT